MIATNLLITLEKKLRDLARKCNEISARLDAKADEISGKNKEKNDPRNME